MKDLQSNIFSGGLNSDDDDRIIPANDYRYALNIRNTSTEEGEIGSIQNTKGTVLLETPLPGGESKVVGHYWDKENNTQFYFLYNSYGFHQIKRYIPSENKVELILEESTNNLGTTLAFDPDIYITEVNLVGDLLYWTDGKNPPRKINIVTASKVSEPNKYKIIYDFIEHDYFVDKITWEIRIIKGTINIVFNITTNKKNNHKEFVQEFVSKLNSSSSNGIPFTNYATASSCGNYAEVTFKNIEDNNFTVNPFGPREARSIKMNQYYNDYTDENISVLKTPLQCPPTVSLESNPERESNYIKNKIFQFRTRLVYVDGEVTALSPISTYAYNPFACGNGEGVNNLIKVDYSDERFADKKFRQELKSVDLYVKEGELGVWKELKSIPMDEVGFNSQYYNFYNDSIYPPISEEESKTPFSAVPRLAGTQEFIKDKLFYADITESFDNVCLDAKLDVNYAEVVEGENGRYTIRGRVRILNLTEEGFQPIWDFGDGPCWGGLSPDGGALDKYVNGVISDYGQSIPLKGFCVYLAGTEKYDITKQNVADYSFNNGGPLVAPVTDTTYNVYNGDKSGSGTGTTDKNNAEGRRALGLLIEYVSGEIYSEFEIKDVPPGEYVVRIASHLTTQEELDDPSLQYQRTSTNTIYTSTEIITTFDESQDPPAPVIGNSPYVTGNSETEIRVKVEDEDADIGTFYVADLTDVRRSGTGVFLNESVAVSGYVVDKDNDVNSPPTPEELLSDKRIELSGVNIDQSESNYLPLLAAAFFPWQAAGAASLIFNYIKDGGYFYTDHNGYFFSTRSVTIGTNFLNGTRIIGALSGEYDLSPAYYEVDSSGNTSTFNKATQTRNHTVYIRNGNDVVSTYSRTRFEGRVATQQGVGVPGISIVNSRGDHQITDVNGEFSLIAYADTKTSPASRRSDVLIYNAVGIECSIELSRSTDNYTINISNTSGHYNNLPSNDDNSKRFSVSLITAFLLEGGLINTEKRGSDKQFGIVYYGKGNQSGFVNTDEQNLKVHINSFNEIDSDEGVILGRQGASISWEVNHKPPIWATHWQWLRTKDSVTTGYLDWVAKKVEYRTDATTISNSNDGKLVYIYIENIADFADRNPNSLVNIIPEKNWKVRFIADENGNFYDEYLEFDILNFTDTSAIVIKNGTFLENITKGVRIEIYDPSPQFDNKLFYEFGECFEIGNPGETTRYHKGLDTDQTATSPATGTFRTGDAWIRQRTIPIDNGEITGDFQDASISDFYESKADHTGRVNAQNPNAKEQRRDTLMRWSDPIIRSTSINGLSTFNTDSLKKLDESYGRLYKLQAVENVLLGIHKNRWVASYIDEGILTTLSGTDSVTKDDAVVGGIRALKGIYGTENRESVVEYQGSVYCWDINRGKVIRYTSNGIFPVSSYKMNNHFLSTSKELLETDGIDKAVIGAFDTNNQEYIMVFKGLNETISYSEKDNRWKSFWSYSPEFIGNTGMNMTSFKEGKLYIHEKSETRNNFYGEQFPSQLKFITNKNPGKVKMFTSIHQESNEAWEAKEILVSKSNVAPNGMKSYIPLGRIRPIEGVQYSDILRDINSPGFNEESKALLNGRHLRGHTCSILLENNLTTNVEIFAANVVIVESEYSKKV